MIGLDAAVVLVPLFPLVSVVPVMQVFQGEPIHPGQGNGPVAGVGRKLPAVFQLGQYAAKGLCRRVGKHGIRGHGQRGIGGQPAQGHPIGAAVIAQAHGVGDRILLRAAVHHLGINIDIGHFRRLIAFLGSCGVVARCQRLGRQE